jgi:predicted AAA+ superfamily ATPase
MALSNRDRIGKGLELTAAGLAPFVERELKSRLDGGSTRSAAGRVVAENPPVLEHSTNKLLSLMLDYWDDVFGESLGKVEHGLVNELRVVEDQWSRNDQINSNDAIRALDSMERLLHSVSASEEAGEIGAIRMDLMRNVFDDQRRQEMRKKSFQPTDGKPQGGLKAWRTVVTPHPDVASGRYQKAEFAADLWQVYQGEGSDEYRDPIEFFRRTFLTEGLKRLLEQAILRLSGRGGDPVVELQTNFGGGKTHSLLALFHLFSGEKTIGAPGVEDLVGNLGVSIPSNVKRCVFVGTQISPGKPRAKPDGTIVRTMWGEIAWQLGGREAYSRIREDDERATNPGDAMKAIFDDYGPCLILIDEWVAYARQLHEAADLPAGTFETQFTFAQALSESVKAASKTLLVVSVPASESPNQKGSRSASDIEVGGERGRAALERLKNAIGRVEASWRPASSDEGFEIVRRRLFQPLTHEQCVARDAVARSFVESYGSQQQEFPSECREADYERRIKSAYPIHPELFDRLFNDWSSIAKFQRTRGVLRLMAAVIHSLWERDDSNLLIMPGTVPIDDSRVQFELTRYLEEQWTPVIEKDVDGENSLPRRIDFENPNLGRYSACRRTARTIYLGSAPVPAAAHRGIDESRIKLGCFQPGETVATFGDSLRRLTDSATYLYVDGKRYWYSTQPTVARLADDRAGQFSDDHVSEEIIKRLREQAKTRGDFTKVHTCAASGDIPDEREARLVILGPEFPHISKGATSKARVECESILENRGKSPRNYRNTLVFLAGDGARLRELDQAVRRFLAWSSIREQKEELNLDQFQIKQAETKRSDADETVNLRITEAYHWLIFPIQPDKNGSIGWTELKVTGQESPAIRVSRKLRSEEALLVNMGGVRLRTELDRIPLWEYNCNHVHIKLLMDHMARYIYLPRLRDEQVLIAAIRSGVEQQAWRTDTFAYAEAWDEKSKRYQGLRAGESILLAIDDRSVIVKPDAAAAQIESDRHKSETRTDKPFVLDDTRSSSGERPDASTRRGSDEGGSSVKTAKQLRRFHGSVQVDPLRLARDAAKIADEVVQHLTALNGANVEITIEIQAELGEDAAQKLVRDVTENCRTLKFHTYGFEES